MDAGGFAFGVRGMERMSGVPASCGHLAISCVMDSPRDAGMEQVRWIQTRVVCRVCFGNGTDRSQEPVPRRPAGSGACMRHRASARPLRHLDGTTNPAGAPAEQLPARHRSLPQQ